MKRIIITKNDEGARLDKLLPGLLDGLSRSRIQRLIDNGEILLNGSRSVKKQPVIEGDIIEISSMAAIDGNDVSGPLPQDMPLDILYEDDWLLAVNKQAGLVVHPGHGVPDGTLVNALLYREKHLADGFSKERPGIVHRLDKDTSGVLLVAKKDLAHLRLAAAFAGRKVEKRYLAICIGKPSCSEGRIELSLDRNRREPLKRAVSPQGKRAITSFKLEQYRSGISVVIFFPHTGRTHQIRVHSSSSGFPVLGDLLYGGGKERILRVNPAERPFAYSIFKCFTRQALHAESISFPHPETQLPLTIQAPLPDDFRNALRLFGDFIYK